MGQGLYVGRISSEGAPHEIPNEDFAMAGEVGDQETATGRLHKDQSTQLNGVSQRVVIGDWLGTFDFGAR
jgi:hypothetical protein